jgi:hypothetical protein
MILNILSRSVGRYPIYGARKVLNNTLKGLIQLGVTVRFNEPIANHKWNWIHDAPEAIIEAGFVGKPVIVGPNTAVMPTDLPRFRKQLHPQSIYLFPSDWAETAWLRAGFSECRTKVWAAGIDLEEFTPRARTSNDPGHILIYLKNRDKALLTQVIDLVTLCGYTYETFIYGHYIEEDYKLALTKAKCGIWVGGTESQGFALMEALASGVPLIVLDAQSMGDNFFDFRNPLTPRFSAEFLATPATTAPYFSESCGVKILSHKLNEIELKAFAQRIETFSPAAYIAGAHSLDHAAEKLMGFFLQLSATNISIASRWQASLSRTLRYLDLATRCWAWRLLAHRFLKRRL